MSGITLEVGKKYVRRDGVGPCLVFRQAAEGPFYVLWPNALERLYRIDGAYSGHEDEGLSVDLVAEWHEGPTLLTDFPINRVLTARSSPKASWWINIYPEYSRGELKRMTEYRTRREADNAAGENRIACVRIVAGQFDDPQPGDPA